MYAKKKIKMKNEIIDYTFNPDEELITFADEFSKNWEILSTMDFSFSQDINPNYTSDNGKYKIMYFDKIYEYFDGYISLWIFDSIDEVCFFFS